MEHKSTAQLKAIAREQLKGKYGTVIATIMAYFAISMILSLTTTFFSSNQNNTSGVIMSMLMSLIISLLMTVLSLGFTKMFINIAREEEYQTTDLFWGFKNHPDKIIIATVLMFLIAIIPFCPAIIFTVCFIITKNTFIGILMVIAYIAGIIADMVISFMYAQVPLILADNRDVSAMEALRLSRKMMKGNKLRYFYLKITFIGWVLLGVLSMGIAYLWIIPYITLTEVHFYLDLS